MHGACVAEYIPTQVHPPAIAYIYCHLSTPPSSPCSVRNLPRRTDPRRPLIISIRFRTQAPADRSLRSAPFCLPSTGVTSFGVAASGNDVCANPRGHNDITRLVFLAFISRFIPLQRDNPPPFVSICLEWCSAF